MVFFCGAAFLPGYSLSLSLQSITHSFSDRAVLSNVNLDVSDGEVVSLVGPSGSGKTTLLKLVAGLEKIQLGKMTLDSSDFASASLHPLPNERPFGFVFQEHVLFPNMSVEKNVGFGISEKNSSDRRRLIEKLLSQVGLSGMAKRFPHTLSGGQKQRVALIRALAREPRLLLMDEPFASVDAPLRKQLIEETRLNLKSTGTSAIIVTHDLDEAMRLGDRVGVLVDGKFLQVDTPETVFNHPQSAFIAEALADFLVIDGKVSGSNRVNTSLGNLSVVLEQVSLKPGQPLKLGYRYRDVGIESNSGNCVVKDVRFVLGQYVVLVETLDEKERFSILSNAFHGLSVGQSVSIKFATAKPYIYY